ncbi:MAG: sugar ABC transporter ATP-binding protein [Sphaerochaetaceae bacterium]|nr:sugar ABC transporter ATP-binding protein [Sphaerochaetaceae bacterium]
MKLEMQGIVKTFGVVQALKGVDFSVSEGEIHGLLGENGAGKTTLMNILAGTFGQDSGDIIINGEVITNMTPRKAMGMKIRFIHQELNLCNDLTVYQNMFLGEELTTARRTVDKTEEIRKAQEVLDSMNSKIDSKALVGSLQTSQKQLVEIARALLFKSELIIMDEPTTALNNQEIQELFVIMRKLKKEGVSFIYISHKMPELFEICDKYTVLRDGQFIQTGAFNEIDTHTATELLIGHNYIEADEKKEKISHKKDEVYLEVSHLMGPGLDDVSFKLNKGEVMVITGLQGSGTDELSMGLFGAGEITSGSIKVKGKEIIKNSIKNAMKDGVALIPKNRKERGILPDLSIKDNLSLAYFTTRQKKIIIDQKKEMERFNRNQELMNIKIGNPKDPITSLSGGNQQKVIFGKWLELQSPVYVMDNPTQGIDVGAKFAIYELIDKIAAKGKAVLVFTNEYPEIHRIADSVVVLYKGKVTGNIERNNMSEVQIMECSTGTAKELL